MGKRILVPLGGSLHTEQAIALAGQISRQSDGTVILAYIVPAAATAPFHNAVSETPARAGEMDIYARTQVANMHLAHAASLPALAGVRTETAVYHGVRTPTILAVAGSHRADIIVLRDQTPSAENGQARGSVARQVSALADVPVLVVRERPMRDATRMRPLRAVVALDGSPSAESALPAAAEIVAALSAPGLGALHLLHVASDSAAVEDGKAYLSSLAHELRRGVLEAHALVLTWSVVRDRDIACALVAQVERPRRAYGADTSVEAIFSGYRTGEITPLAFDGGDLLVVASHAPMSLRRSPMRHVVEDVLHLATCPVLVVRAPVSVARDRALREHLPVEFEEVWPQLG